MVAIAMSLVDSYRRRGKKPKPFPTRTAQETPVGDGTVTTYTFGQDLYDDMLAAIEGAQQQVLLETYIWKGDAVGQRFKKALIDAADRGVEVRVIYDSFANLVVPPPFKHFPPDVKVLAYPVYAAGWRFFDLRRYGRDHRKILVVDDKVGFVGGYNIGAPYATEWRDTHCRITGPGVWDLARAFADFWNLHRDKRFRRERAADADDHGLDLGAAHPRAPQRPPAVDVPDPVDVPRGDQPGAAQHLDDARLLHPRRGLRRRPGRGGRARGRRTPAAAGEVQPHRGRLDLARVLPPMLDAGIAIHRFRDAMVHAKTATIDGNWSTIGTANVDRLSMSGNYEINVEIIDASLAEEMERIFETDLTNALPLTPRRVGGARRLQPVHRDDPEAPAPVALTHVAVLNDGYWVGTLLSDH